MVHRVQSPVLSARVPSLPWLLRSTTQYPFPLYFLSKSQQLRRNTRLVNRYMQSISCLSPLSSSSNRIGDKCSVLFEQYIVLKEFLPCHL